MNRIFNSFKRFIEWLLPHIRGFARLVSIMIIASAGSLWVGVPEARKRIAEQWRDEFINKWGIPSEHGHIVYVICASVATVAMLISWLVTAALTMLVLRILL